MKRFQLHPTNITNATNNNNKLDLLYNSIIYLFYFVFLKLQSSFESLTPRS